MEKVNGGTLGLSSSQRQQSGTSDTIAPTCLSFVGKLSSFRGYFVQSGVYTRSSTKLMVCHLLGGLSSFGVSIIGGSTVV